MEILIENPNKVFDSGQSVMEFVNSCQHNFFPDSLAENFFWGMQEMTRQEVRKLNGFFEDGYYYDEISQKSILKILERGNKQEPLHFSSPKEAASYSRKVIRSTMVSLWRKEPTEEITLDKFNPDFLDVNTRTLEENSDNRLTVRDCIYLMEETSGKRGQALLMFLEGYDYPEISEELKITPGYARQLVFRMLNDIRNQVER